MRHFLFTCFLLLSLVSNAQHLDFNQPLPDDTSIKKGVLPNGLTYYIYSTDVNKDAASYYIIQNVGSILESDDQKGLAHFLEHMAFNGTESFPGKAFLNKLQEHGLVFGRDINAYTSFDETVYNINKLPTTPELTEVGLQILHDWSNHLLLTAEEIDAERGVIKEEWRTRQNGGMRILEKTIGTVFGHSKYADRLPIGSMDIVANFDYGILRDFYHDWYRTDLQAIAVIGDFDSEEMEAKIKAKFSSIPAIENAPQRFTVAIEDNETLAFDMATDKEVSTASIAFNIRRDKSLQNETVADLRTALFDNMISGIINTRLQDISSKPDAPFIRMGVFNRGMARLHDNFGVQIFPKPDKQQEAFTLAMNELNRAVKFGFTNAEIKRAIAQFNSSYENQIATWGNRSHRQIAQGITTNYLENAHLTDINEEYKIVKAIFDALQPQDLLERMREIYTQKNRNVVVTGVEGKDNLTEAQANAIIKASENDDSLLPYEEEEEETSLMTGVNLKPGKIVFESKNKDLGFITYELSNGIKVHYKFVDKDKNQVALEAISYGGQSLLGNEDLPTTQIMSGLASMSGLGTFSATDLPKVLAGKKATTNFSIGNLTETVTGSSSTKDVETLLQMVNLRFTKPRFTQTDYTVFMQNVDNYLIRKSQDLGAKMQDSITTTLYGKNHPTKRIFDADYVAEMSFDKVEPIYTSRFGNAADFNFFIVGDVSENDLKPLLREYIASIPTNKQKEQWKDNSTDWSSKNIDKDIVLPMQNPKGRVNIMVKKEMPYSLKNEMLVNGLGYILQLRYTETLREEEGGTYGSRVNARLSKRPKPFATISVNFDCNPALVENLVSIVYEEMETIKNGEILTEDFEKAINNFLKERNDSKNFNRYDMRAIKNYVLEGYNMDLPENFENIVNSITKEDFQNMAQKILTDHQSYEIVFKPQE